MPLARKATRPRLPAWNPRPTPIRKLLCVLLATVGAVTFDSAAIAQSRTPTSSCSRGKVVVQPVVPQHVHEACEAVLEVLSYFDSVGFEIDVQVTVAFKGDIEAEGGHMHAHGSYEPGARAIKLYSREQARPWGEPWQNVRGSFIRHEVVHAAVVQMLATRAMELPREWHEFIAYAVQFELMAPTVRDRILERYAHVVPVPALTQINPFTHGLADPDIFAVLVFKSYRKSGGRDLVHRLLTGDFVPTSLDGMMPFPPNQR